mgnify:CR=1 FL=1
MFMGGEEEGTVGVDTRVGVWEVAWARRVAGVGVCAGVCGGVRSTFEEIVQEASLFHAHHHHAHHHNHHLFVFVCRNEITVVVGKDPQISNNKGNISEDEGGVSSLMFPTK